MNPLEKMIINKMKTLPQTEKVKMIEHFQAKHKGNPNLEKLTEELKKAIEYDANTKA